MTSFLVARWRGEAPLETVFWRDMMLAGTLLNVAATAAALGLFAADVPAALALPVFLVPLPWSFFLFVAVWRSAERTGGPGALTAKIVSALWLIAMIAL